MTADSLFSLKGKTALVTGASYGLGVTFAETLAGAGANLVLAARSLDKLQALAARLTADGHNVLAVKCDVGNPEDVAATVAEGWKRFGRIDILVNNAGVVAEATVVPEKIPHELFEQTMRVNVLGHVVLLSRSGGAATSRRQGRVNRQHRVGRGDGRGGRFSDRLPDVEGGGHQPHAQPGVQLGGTRDSRERNRAGLVSERDDRPGVWHRRVPSLGQRSRATATDRRSERAQRSAAAPLFRRWKLHDRSHARRRRWALGDRRRRDDASECQRHLCCQSAERSRQANCCGEVDPTDPAAAAAAARRRN